MGKSRPTVALTEDAVDAALREVDGACRLVVSARPKSAKEGLEVGTDGGVVVRVSAPPTDGKANARIAEVVAAALGIAKSDVAIARGQSARNKELAIALTTEQVRARLTSPKG